MHNFIKQFQLNIMKFTKYFFLFIILVVLNFCSSSIPVERLPEISILNGFFNPRLVEGELTVHIDSIKVFKGEQLEKWNEKYNIPKSQKPILRLWSSVIKEQTNQRNVTNDECSISPIEIFTDDENGNKIYYWDLSDSLLNRHSLTLKRKFTYTAYDYKPAVDSDIVMQKWNEIPRRIKSFYTKSEKFLVQSERIRSTAKSICGNERNPYTKARLIFNWIRDTMTYIYPPEKRGANEALIKGEGDCGQYSNLFIALARSAGIPARQQSGFMFTLERISYHVWSEIYLPVYGWVPVDATKKDGFCFLDNKRLIASVGMNIPLLHTPPWATYENSEVENGVTDFMQLVTIVKSGFEAKIYTERKVLQSENL